MQGHEDTKIHGKKFRETVSEKIRNTIQNAQTELAKQHIQGKMHKSGIEIIKNL